MSETGHAQSDAVPGQSTTTNRSGAANKSDGLTANGGTSAGQAGSPPLDYRWLLGFVRPHRARLLVVLLLSLIRTGLGLAQPYLSKFLIDDGLLGQRFDLVLWFCGLMVGAGLFASLLGGLNRWQYVDVSARILHALRESVFAHLLRLPPTYFSRTQGGDILARLDGDIAEVQRFAVDTLLAFVNGVLALIGALLLMLSLSLPLSLLALLLLPANALFLRFMRPRVEQQTRTVRERASAVTTFFFERLGAVKFIQSVAAEPREAGRLHELNNAFRTDTLRLQMVNYTTSAVPALFISINTALVFIIGGWYTIQGTLTVGTLIAFSAYMARATGPVQTLLGLYIAWQRAQVSLQRVQEITRLQPAVRLPDKARSLPPTACGQLHFEHVAFRYEADPKPVLKDITIALPAGKKIALAGVSGVGKSTLIDLLQRHYDPSGGRILLDGVNLRQLDLAELRRRIVVVGQDTTLFAGSLLDNLRYAAPAASDEQIRQVARRAQVDEFARQLPQGYASDIGPRGSALSGGQRQRIAIARALLLDPLVLILDEATSAVDTQTEAEIIKAIDQLFADRTRLLISHRSETLQGADVVLELIGGYLIPQDRSAQRGLMH